MHVDFRSIVILLFSFISFQLSLSHCFSIRISSLACKTSEDWRNTNPKIGLVKPTSINFPTGGYVQTA
jgi:hypothetical protein